MKFVFYQNKLYNIIHEYDSGMVEIRRVNGYETKLIEKEKLVPLKKVDNNGDKPN